MSRPSQIRFLSQTAPFYDWVVRAMGFSGLWAAMALHADPAPGTRCLDVCTGTGGVALALAARGASVVAIDLAGGMLIRAQRKAQGERLAANVQLAQMDARRLAFADGHFPLVTCCMAIHEMAESERTGVLAELRRVAQGRVLIAEYRVPASRFGRAAFRIGRGFEFLESDDFENFLARAMPERLEAAGLHVEAASNAGSYRIWKCRTPAGGR